MSLLKLLTTISVFLCATSCYHVPRKLEPEITYAAQDSYIKSLPPPFSPLSEEEKNTHWGQEYTIGLAFAEDLDLYRAISTFKRAEILISDQSIDRKNELQYLMVLSYYLAKKYDDAIYIFEHSELKEVRHSFSAYHDLLLILYESYRENNEPKKAEYIYTLIKGSFPETAEKLAVSTAYLQGDLVSLTDYSASLGQAVGTLKDELADPTSYTSLALVKKKAASVNQTLDYYTKNKKSIAKAELLNILPGAGYLYVGQKQTAVTAFLLNGLFIAATAHFFHKGEYAAGIITAGFEAGWYFGGIYGAGEAAKLYNERLYEKKVYETMSTDALFPVLQLNYGF